MNTFISTAVLYALIAASIASPSTALSREDAVQEEASFPRFHGRLLLLDPTAHAALIAEIENASKTRAAAAARGQEPPVENVAVNASVEEGD